MATCVAKNCPNYGRRNLGQEGVTYHPFPKNPTLRAKWIKQMNQDDFQPGPLSVLCSLHFIKEYFVTDIRGTQHLKQDAIPTEFEFDSTMDTDTNDDDTIACCAYRCTNTYNPDSPVTFHPFPIDQPDLCDQWLLAMNVTQVAAKQAVLCSEHFDESCFVEGENGERLLIADAVPSIFLYPDDSENGDIYNTEALNLPNETIVKLDLGDASLELIQKHDDTVNALNEESRRLIDLAKERCRLEKEKKDLDFLLQSVLNGVIPDKTRLPGLKSLIKSVDEVTKQIVADCLAPCVSTQVNQEIQE